LLNQNYLQPGDSVAMTKW